MNEEWAKAFVKAQGELPDITKDKTVTVKTKTGQSFKYSYADLPTIVAKVRPVLAKNGLAVAQDVEIQEGRVVVTTRIYHTSGHMETFGPVVLNGGNDAQAAGSAITYARRYALCAALNIAADEDDDGQINKNSAGSTPSSASQPRKTEPKPSGSPPKHSGGGADGSAHTPSSQAADNPAPPPDHSQKKGSGEVARSSEAPTQLPGGDSQQGVIADPDHAAPSAAESWLLLIENFGQSNVLKAAQEKAKEAGEKLPFTKKALNDLSKSVFDSVATELAETERVAS